MGHVIITALSLAWVLLTILATLAVFSAVLTPKWLLGAYPLEVENGTIVPTVGIFNRCTRIKGQNNCAVFAMDGLATDSSVFPSFWKVSLVLFALGLVVMVLTTMAALVSCCVQSINRKSIFTLTGTVQATAGLFYILGLVLYAAGWGSARVIKLCGRDAGPFTIGDCSFGWAMYIGVIGICLTFLTACLSVCAEKTTSSDKVSRKVERGETLVCLL
ncbi:LHFPL tetraspan subfamily member 2 protein-like [Homalodisca vitripennis]|uniref:LHFPL tetraspan subfamily member 2 protein-like n=1 Tax=Homalodisca vitripennis TaxID=197043 RepID=UPI001EECC817|nr:LHFPL tetraspan subfamily member 2 protein-like [Homalodisca vitripennis]XP_046665692.1 LHFPL tetraspan subfamily member 2 protein-like [Homalodisca vitripennis]KAG8281604.1 positive regulation of fertilization [Homalodisca vitripennis]